MDISAEKALNAVSSPIVVAAPVRNDQGTLIDLNLVWANEAMYTSIGELPIIGQHLSVLFPNMIESGWLAEVDALRATGDANVRFREALPMYSSEDLFELVSKWLDEELVVQVESLRVPEPGMKEGLRAASLITQLVPELPISFGVHVADVWHRFPSQAFLRAIRMSLPEFEETSIADFVHEFDVERVLKWMKTPLRKKTLPLIFRAVSPGLPERWLEMWMAEIDGPVTDEAFGNFYVVRDVDATVRLQRNNETLLSQLDAKMNMLAAALNASRDGFAVWESITDAETGAIVSFRLDYINEVGAAATGQPPRVLQGRRIEDVVGGEQSGGLQALFTKALVEGRPQISVVDVDSPNGWVGAYENKVIPFDHNQVVATFRDVSEERREQDRLKWLAEHDHLTGAPNRRQMERDLEDALRLARERHRLAGFVFLDIDWFKRINDDYGHDVGDVILTRFVERVRSVVGSRALVARIAGDEFAIVASDLDSAQNLRELMEQIFASLKTPFNESSPSISLSCSAGCVVTDGNQPLGEIMRVADKAMYRAKHDGRNRFEIVELSLEEPQN